MMREATCVKCNRVKAEGIGWNKRVQHSDGSGVYFTHDECPERVCKKRVNTDSWTSRICSRDGKEATEEGWLCGIHLAAYRRRKANDIKRKVEWDASEDNRRRSEYAVDILQELGVDGRAHYDATFTNRYTGKVIIDAQDLLKLAGIRVELPEVK